MNIITDYVNTSRFIGCGWTPMITGYDETGDIEFPFELDLYENSKVNWKEFKKKYSGAKNYKAFYREFVTAKEEIKLN